MSAPMAVNRDRIKSIPEAANPREMHEVARQVGPVLLRLMKERDLTPKEGRLLRAIKEICPCHYTNSPADYVHDGETCEICGRQK